jgi:hypothetical protein
MKKKVFIVQYHDVENNEVYNFMVESTNKRTAIRLAHELHTPGFDDEDDEFNEDIKQDFYDNTKVIAVIDAPVKNVKLLK